MTISSYTRKELEGMKRSELQRLFKIYNLKGANGTNASLIDILSSHLTEYNDVHDIVEISESVVIRSPKKSRATATLIRTSSKKGKEKEKEKEKAVESDKLNEDYITSAQVEHLLIARDTLWETRLASLAKSMGQVQDRLHVELKKVREDLENVRNTCALLERRFQAGSSTISGVLGKHSRGHSLGDSLTDEEADNMDDESSEAKRVRFGGTSTPPPRASSEIGQATNITPRTPPPAHQGIRAEQWRTPRSTTREEHLLYHHHQHRENGGEGSGSSLSLSDDDDDDGRVPEFGGTPKPPTERPSSPTPTMERILSSTSNSDREAAAAAGAMRARRAESVTLSNVTDLPRIEEGDEAASPFIRRAVPKQRLSGLLGPPALIRRRADSERPDSSSRLAPGAIIGQGHGHNRTSSLSGAVGVGGGGGGGRPSRGASTPPRRLVPTEYESTLPGGGTRSASADYMHVAMHGLLGPPPPTLTRSGGTGVTLPPVTPGQRTMLGTERWNDTRFGDIPIPLALGEEGNWESPKVDWLGGPATPL